MPAHASPANQPSTQNQYRDQREREDPRLRSGLSALCSQLSPRNAVNASQRVQNAFKRVQNVKVISGTHVQRGPRRLIPHSPPLIPSPATTLTRTNARKREISFRATLREGPAHSCLIPHAPCPPRVLPMWCTCARPCARRVLSMCSRVLLCVFFTPHAPPVGSPRTGSRKLAAGSWKPRPVPMYTCAVHALPCARMRSSCKITPRKLQPATWRTASRRQPTADGRRLEGCGSYTRNEEWGMRNETGPPARWLTADGRQPTACMVGVTGFEPVASTSRT